MNDRPTSDRPVQAPRPMRPVNKIAVVLVAVASAVALLEFAVSALTGGIPFGTNTQAPAMAWPVRLVHVAAEVSILAVLLRNARTIDAGRRSRTALRLVVLVASAAYLAFMLALELLVPQIDALWQGPAEGFPWWFEVMNAVGLVGLAAPWALGITMLVQGDRSPAAWLLAAAVPMTAVTYLLPFVLGGPWAALPLGGVIVSFGLALLGARGDSARNETPATT